MSEKVKQNKIFIILIAALICVLVVVGILLAVNSNSRKAMSKVESQNAQIKDYKTQLKTASEDKARLESEKTQLEAEKAKLEEENSGLQKQVADLMAKKKSAGSKGVCYLTFDDGPSDNTLRNLETLKKYNAKATFFVIGSAKLDYLKNIVADGHAIGLHSNTHDYAKIYTSTDAFFADLLELSSKVKSITGKDVNITRFPGGSSNTVSRKYCSGIMTSLSKLVPEKGYEYFDWNISSGDASGNNIPADTIVKNVLNGASGKDSICVLMHDTSAKSTTSDALPRILEGLTSMGFRFETLTKSCYGFHQSVNN